MFGPWFVIALLIMAGWPWNTHRDLHRPAADSFKTAKAAKSKTSVVVKNTIGLGTTDFNSMKLANEVLLRRYTYKFEGRATHQGKPCSNAGVTVRIITPHQSMTHGAITDENGKYSIEVTLHGADSDPVDWAMEAYTPDFQKVELLGRRIITQEEETVTVQNPVQFAVAQSVPAR